MKRSRQNKILELVGRHEIETQAELARHLQESGFSVTQATVSRDIRELALLKISGKDGKTKYAAADYGGVSPPAHCDSYARVLRDGIVSIEQAGNLIVIRTVSGMAMAVAAAVDVQRIEEIAGSIAGDDTVMCAIKVADSVPAVIGQLKDFWRKI